MKPLNHKTAHKQHRPERIIQFGEGNFLRAFADWMVSQMNNRTDFNGSVVVVKPRPGGSLERLQSQDGLFHVNLQGLQAGQPMDSLTLVDSISRSLNPYEEPEAFMALAEQPDMRFVISNTTEAGIIFDSSSRFTDKPASAFPAKLTQLLWHRFRAFGGRPDKGLIILPCELIFQNGQRLRECIMQYIELWAADLGTDAEPFRQWVLKACPICSTLVDRIVPGAPKKGIEDLQARCGYDDQLIVQAETYHLWVIETPTEEIATNLAKEWPAAEAGLNVLFVHDEAPYHKLKVTLLNGPHTVLSPVAFLAGLDIVREACQHPVVGQFVRRVMYDELLPTLDLPETELRQYADSVIQRFLNPYVDHQVTSIMLNSFPKFKTRDLPALKEYLRRRGTLPQCIVLGLAAIVTYYKGGIRSDGAPITPNDDAGIIALLTKLWENGDPAQIAQGVLAAESVWGENLNQLPNLTQLLAKDLEIIQELGMMQALKNTLS